MGAGRDTSHLSVILRPHGSVGVDGDTREGRRVSAVLVPQWDNRRAGSNPARCHPFRGSSCVALLTVTRRAHHLTRCGAVPDVRTHRQRVHQS